VDYRRRYEPFNGLGDDSFNRLGFRNLNTFLDDNLFRLAATLRIVIFG
jgi:hypothetical protein